MLPLQSRLRKNIDLADIVGWVLQHPKRHLAFPGWDEGQITLNLVEYNRADNLIAIADPALRVNGILTYDVHDETKTLRIQAILTEDNDDFATLVALWAERYPTYSLEAIRDCTKHRTYKLRNFSRYLKQGQKNLEEPVINN